MCTVHPDTFPLLPGLLSAVVLIHIDIYYALQHDLLREGQPMSHYIDGKAYAVGSRCATCACTH